MDLDGFLNLGNLASTIHGWLGDGASLIHERGGGTGIAFASPPGVTGGDVERALARYQIPVWGRRVTGHITVDGVQWGTWSLRTESHRADWARYIIWRAHCRVLHDPNPQNAEWAAGHSDLPPSWAEQANGVADGNLHAGDNQQAKQAKRVSKNRFW